MMGREGDLSFNFDSFINKIYILSYMGIPFSQRPVNLRFEGLQTMNIACRFKYKIVSD